MNPTRRRAPDDPPPAEVLHDTKARILDAAFRRVAREGYGALTVREVARDAGVNHALVNYHFKSKDQLVIAVLDEANRRLLTRQTRMYRSPGDYADKWAQARRFYENDLASGFVRVLMELYAASMSNPALRDAFVPRMNAWYDVVEQAVRDAIAHYGLELDVTPEAIACWIGNFWIGMEISMLAGTGNARSHREALDAFERLLQRLDAQANERAGAPSAPKSAPKSAPSAPRAATVPRQRSGRRDPERAAAPRKAR